MSAIIRENIKNILFAKVNKIYKTCRISLIKIIKDPYAEICKTYMENIEEDLNR